MIAILSPAVTEISNVGREIYRHVLLVFRSWVMDSIPPLDIAYAAQTDRQDRQTDRHTTREKVKHRKSRAEKTNREEER